jgi:hypothetical protein
MIPTMKGKYERAVKVEVICRNAQVEPLPYFYLFFNEAGFRPAIRAIRKYAFQAD